MSTSTPSFAVPADAHRSRPARPPATVVTGAVLQLLITAVTTVAVFYFSFIDAARPTVAVGLAFVGVYWTANAVGAAGSIGLLRGRGLGRKVLIGYGVYAILFSLAKLIIWHEPESVLFVALGLVLIGLGVAAPTRRYAS